VRDGVDGDLDGQPNEDATGDDADGNDDEQGVIFPNRLFEGSSQNLVEVSASASGLLDAWFDFNGDGDWNDQSEQTFASTPLVAGSNILSFAIPVGAVTGSAFARFRISSAGNLSPIGPAIDGEVEDYELNVLSSGIFKDSFEGLAPSQAVDSAHSEPK
jgi:hypothetical protein